MNIEYSIIMKKQQHLCNNSCTKFKKTTGCHKHKRCDIMGIKKNIAQVQTIAC